MWVVKLGGSLLGSPQLNLWLDAIANQHDEQIIIVPGGGVFADAVREAQKLSGISDESAHRLAVLAMDQYGMLLAGMNPKLKTVKTLQEITSSQACQLNIIWLPSEMVLADASIPTNWDVTSDSLAAWLTAQIADAQLLLVKSLRLECRQATAEQLSQEGLIDAWFADFIKQKPLNVWLLSKDDHKLLEAGLSRQQLNAAGVSIIRKSE